MKICVFGLGYVGVVTASCLAKEGHTIIGVDISKQKVEEVNNGVSPIVEEGISDLIKSMVADGRLIASMDYDHALAESEIAFICVGTPSLPNGAINERAITAVISQIAEHLKNRSVNLLVVVRSTVAPGTMKNTIIPLLEKTSGKSAGTNFEIVFHPEFLREGSSIFDFYNPPKIVIGERVPGGGKLLVNLYGDRFNSPRVLCSMETAEMVKYCDNIFHAVKITFANEIGKFCHSLGLNGPAVMEIFCQDTKLNISSNYFRPGFAFGGSCLPKDLRAFLSIARRNDMELPMMQSILRSNIFQIESALQMVLSLNKKQIGFYGIAFKKGTDDLRESPFVELAERLIGKGKNLVCFDGHVQIARLIGGNKSYVEEKLPHLAELLTDEISRLHSCELLVLCHEPAKEVLDYWLASGKPIVDLTGNRGLSGLPNYHSVV